MKKMNRTEFLKLGALSVLSPMVTQALGQNGEKLFQQFGNAPLLQQLIDANDSQVAELIDFIKPGLVNFTRRIASDFSCLSASFVTKDSRYYHNTQVAGCLQYLVSILQKKTKPQMAP